MDLHALVRTLRDPTLPLPQRVRAAAQVWAAVALAQAAVEPFKEVLRQEARRLLGGHPGNAVVEGEGLSRALVTVPAMAVQLKDPPSLEQAQRELGDDFSLVYRVELKLVPRTPDELESLPPGARNHLMDRVSIAEGKPRVSFSSMEGTTPL